MPRRPVIAICSCEWNPRLYSTSLLLLFLMPRTRSVRFFSNIFDVSPLYIHIQGKSYVNSQKCALSTAFSKRKLILPRQLQHGGVNLLCTLGNASLKGSRKIIPREEWEGKNKIVLLNKLLFSSVSTSTQSKKVFKNASTSFLYHSNENKG